MTAHVELYIDGKRHAAVLADDPARPARIGGPIATAVDLVRWHAASCRVSRDAGATRSATAQFAWYGLWYGDQKNHHHASEPSGGRNSRTGRGRSGAKRFRIRAACRRSGSFRCGRMEGDAARCAAANGRPAHQKGAGVGRRAALAPGTEAQFPEREGCVSGITFD